MPALRGGFTWDDDAYVTNNITLRSAPGLSRIWGQLTATPQYYPLVFTSFWLEYHLWGLNPLGYHIVNVLLHTLAAMLLWRVLVRLQVPGAWLAAGIFALHPVAVESVAWVTERKNVLSAVFYFAAALAYLRWQERETSDRGANAHYFLSLTLFICALFSKTVTASLPAALLLVMWWKRGRVAGRDVRPLVPFFVAGAALALVTAWLERTHVGASGPDWALSFLDRCLIAGRALWFYAGKLLVARESHVHLSALAGGPGRVVAMAVPVDGGGDGDDSLEPARAYRTGATGGRAVFRRHAGSGAGFRRMSTRCATPSSRIISNTSPVRA